MRLVRRARAGNSLFQAPVLEAIFNATKEEGFAPIEGGIQHNLALQMVFCAAIGLPGYYVAVCLMDRLGRRNIQLQGFIMMGITYGALGIWLHDLQGLAPPAGTMLLLLLYGCTFFFSNFGPNSTTFIVREPAAQRNPSCPTPGPPCILTPLLHPSSPSLVLIPRPHHDNHRAHVSYRSHISRSSRPKLPAFSAHRHRVALTLTLAFALAFALAFTLALALALTPSRSTPSPPSAPVPSCRPRLSPRICAAR